MADTNLMPLDELKQFDQDLLAWHSNIHPILREAKHSPEPIRMASVMLRFRHLNQRMTLYRPHMLISSLMPNGHGQAPSTEDSSILADVCDSIAQETVQFVSDSWYPNQYLAWNSSWFLFQAALVILLKLFTLPPGADTRLHECAVVESLKLLNQMRKWRGSAADSHDLLQFIYESREHSQGDLEAEPTLTDDKWMMLLRLDAGMDQMWPDWFEFGEISNENGIQGPHL
jgi:hypothetical protein